MANIALTKRSIRSPFSLPADRTGNGDHLIQDFLITDRLWRAQTLFIKVTSDQLVLAFDFTALNSE